MLKNIKTNPLNIKLHKRYALTCIQWDSIRSRITKIESSSNVFVWNESVRFFQRYEETGLRETRNSPSRCAHGDENERSKVDLWSELMKLAGIAMATATDWIR